MRSLVPSTEFTLREANIEARRQRILAAARELIASGGMAALSMRKLAAEAGVSVTTLYNLFGARDDILRAIIEDAVDQMDAILDSEAPLDDPLARCRAIITVSVRHFDQNEAIYRPMMVASYEGLSLQGHGEHPTARRAAGMQRLAIESAIEKGLLRDTLDPARLGEQIYHGYELACVQWAFGQLDAKGFETRALYGLYVAVLAVASDGIQPEVEAELAKLERKLARGTRGRPQRARRKGGRS